MQTEALDDGLLEHWTAEEVAAGLRDGTVLLIDVRKTAEQEAVRIDGSTSIPLAALDPDALPEQDDRRIVFLCATGARSRQAAEACIAVGEERVAHLERGLEAWRDAGLPVVPAAQGGDR